jgi:hypothetical protein
MKCLSNSGRFIRSFETMTHALKGFCGWSMRAERIIFFLKKTSSQSIYRKKRGVHSIARFASNVGPL